MLFSKFGFGALGRCVRVHGLPSFVKVRFALGCVSCLFSFCGP